MTNYKSKRKGFTLLELMVVVAIVAILAAIAIPSYLQQTNKAQFTEVVAAADNLKKAVANCAMAENPTSGLAGCDSGKYGIPPVLTNPSQNVASVGVTNGVITAVAKTANGLTGQNYILTPAYHADHGISWVPSGTACATHLVKCPPPAQ